MGLFESLAALGVRIAKSVQNVEAADIEPIVRREILRAMPGRDEIGNVMPASLLVNFGLRVAERVRGECDDVERVAINEAAGVLAARFRPRTVDTRGTFTLAVLKVPLAAT